MIAAGSAWPIAASWWPNGVPRSSGDSPGCCGVPSPVSMTWLIRAAATPSAARSASAGSTMRARAPESLNTCATSGGARRVLTGTNTAPSWAQANITARNSGLFSPRKATGSPVRIPRCQSTAEMRSVSSASARYVMVWPSPKISAVFSGVF